MKTIREQQEERERNNLNPFASFSNASLGRDFYEEPCDIRPVYQRDRDRILHCKSFRRLKHKTQVFLQPQGDHYRTRLTHTLEVSQNARTIAKALCLNEDLTEAIALGHDLGHAPFGHAGEKALNAVCPGGFAHNIQSIYVVERLEKYGKGLNLTKEVRDGILNHQTSGNPITLEGKIVRLSDKIAYLNHDIDDAIRANIITEEEIPLEYTNLLGHSAAERLNTLIHNIVKHSYQKSEIQMSNEIEKALFGLRKYMFEVVYYSEFAKKEEKKAEQVVIYLYEYYKKHLELLPEEYRKMIEEEETFRVVCHYIAGMTDRFAIAKLKECIIPNCWNR